MTDIHALERSNAKGQPFVGYCTKCGKTGLTFADMREPCANPAGETAEDAVINAIMGPTQ
jgi:hypothetical protein